ncbi:MAG: NTP transferase domain-containing protein [Candidatus Eisenbacteria bacterium]|nr:NTP transferase domain-containing protein [Candidatus Latescibacterota bacterium]MBD3301938.1 NTP transferase domain-containing protein [Candidatus Eisenbacteria bacterium]
MSWRAVVLAAGKGTRMKSDLAKVLHRREEETLLGHVLRTAATLGLERTAVIVGHQREEVRAEHARFGVETFVQEPQLGTGHAVQQAAPFLEGHDGHTLILYGDVPLLRRTTLLELMEEHLHAEDAATVLTARMDDPTGYGRIVRSPEGSLEAIVEDRDLETPQRAIDEINSGIYAYRTPQLLRALHGLKNDNRQKEYYLTDTIRDLRAAGEPVGTYRLHDVREISGINTPVQLAEAAAILEARRRTGTFDCPVCEWSEPREGLDYPVIHRGAHVVLAVSDAPYNSGQLVVVPRRHRLRHSGLAEEERKEMWEVARIAAELVETAYHPQGLNLGYTAGEPGRHLALQVVPRWVGDTNFMPVLTDTTLLPEALEQTHRRLRRTLEERGKHG